MSEVKRINPAARFIARNARHWDPVAAFHLLEALSHNLATLFPPRERFAKLGLLIRLIAKSPSEVPPVRAYDVERAKTAQHGETWPSRSDLNYAFGSWPKAVKAAHRAHYGNRKVQRSTRYARLESLAYAEHEILTQIRACREAIGFTPRQWEYEKWARVARDLLRRAGQIPRIPGIKQIREAFGSFDNALVAARDETQND